MSFTNISSDDARHLFGISGRKHRREIVVSDKHEVSHLLSAHEDQRPYRQLDSIPFQLRMTEPLLHGLCLSHIVVRRHD